LYTFISTLHNAIGIGQVGNGRGGREAPLTILQKIQAAEDAILVFVVRVGGELCCGGRMWRGIKIAG
jgi:hypothetical protein